MFPTLAVKEEYMYIQDVWEQSAEKANFTYER
jgi:hypothetical protein